MAFLYAFSADLLSPKAPKISDTYPEEVMVNSNDILATNGKGLSQDNWNYNNKTGIININIENNNTYSIYFPSICDNNIVIKTIAKY